MLRAPGGLYGMNRGHRRTLTTGRLPRVGGFAAGSLLEARRVRSPQEGGEGHDEGRKPLTTTTVNGGAEGVPFRDFGISDAICSGLEAAGIFTTFPIPAPPPPLAPAGPGLH